MTVNWSPTSKVAWTCGQYCLKFINDTDYIYSSFDDVSVTIKKRARKNYGTKVQLFKIISVLQRG